MVRILEPSSRRTNGTATGCHPHAHTLNWLLAAGISPAAEQIAEATEVTQLALNLLLDGVQRPRSGLFRRLRQLLATGNLPRELINLGIDLIVRLLLCSAERVLPARAAVVLGHALVPPRSICVPAAHHAASDEPALPRPERLVVVRQTTPDCCVAAGDTNDSRARWTSQRQKKRWMCPVGDFCERRSRRGIGERRAVMILERCRRMTGATHARLWRRDGGRLIQRQFNDNLCLLTMSTNAGRTGSSANGAPWYGPRERPADAPTTPRRCGVTPMPLQRCAGVG